MTKFLNNADIKGYIAQTAVTSYLLKADSTGRLVAAIAGTDYQAPTTALLPSGGTAGQILAKIDGTNYNAQWIDNFAQQIKYDVKLGAALSKGTPVYVSSANGTNIIVSASSNATEATSSKTLGLLETGGALNDIVKVVSDGLLSGLNTSAATIGDPVWLGVNGALIFGLANKPSAPAHLVYIGAVTRVHATNGEIFIKVQNGFELDELHNVSALTPSNNDVLYYNTSTSLWQTASIPTVLGYTPEQSLTFSSPLVRTVNTISIPAATASVNGYLSSADWTTFNSKQAALSGTGFVKISGTTISYDNSTYLTTSAAASTYLSLTGGTLTGDLTLSGTNPKIYLTDTDNNPDYFISNTDGTFTVYDVTNSIGRFKIYTTGVAEFTNQLTAASFVKSGGTASQFLKADGSVDSTSYVPTSRTLTINGTAYDLSADRSWTIASYSLPIATASILGGVKIGSGVSIDAGGVISVSTNYQAPLSGTGFVKISGTTISYDNSTYLTTASAASTYLMLGGGTMTGALIGTSAGFTGYVGVGNTSPLYPLDVTGNARVSGQLILGSTISTTIATVTYTYTLPSASGTIALVGGAGVGTVTSVSGTGTVSGLTLTGTVTSSGSLTLGGTLSLTSGQVTTALGYTPYNSTNPSGYITGITSGMVTTALGYTPYNSTNPAGYITSSSSITGASNALSSNDIRTIAPNSGTASRAMFGFTSWNNNNTAPWADYFLLRSYSDSSGGADNLITFNKSGIGMRIWQQTYGSASAFSSYVDVLHSSNYSSYALPLTGGTLTGALRVGGSVGAINLFNLYKSDNTTLGGQLAYDSSINQLYLWNNISTGYFSIYTNSAERFKIAADGTTTNNGYVVLHAGNYNSYSPTLTGGGASGTWGINITGSAATATDSTKLPLTGGTLSGNLLFSDSGTTKRGIQGTVGTNDFWFVGGGATATNAGFMEIATGDDAQTTGSSEPIYVSQYGPGDPLTGTLYRRAKLLDEYGNTLFPGTITSNADSSGASIVAQNNGNAARWYGRIGSFNSTSDKAAFVGTYASVAVVGAHNNALTAWANLYVNNVDGSNGGNVYLPTNSYIASNVILHAGNYSSYALPISGGAISGTLSVKNTSSLVQAPYQSDHDFPNGAYIQTDIVVSAGEPWTCEITAFNYGNGRPTKITINAYNYGPGTYYAGYAIATGLVISGMSVFQNSAGYLCLYIPSQGYWNAYNVNWYVNYRTTSSNRVTSISNSAKPTGISYENAVNPTYSLDAANYNSYSPTLTGGNASGTWGINVTGYSNSVELSTRIWFNGSGYHNVSMYESYGIVMNCVSTPWNVQVLNGSFLVGTNAAGGNYGIGNGYFTGDVTAYYSDKRLKHELKPIESALEKIKLLTGYTYKHNKLGQQLLNENAYKVHVGFVAQEVQKVLPEIVTIAPFDLDGYDEYGNGISKSGNDYLTIKYERIAPLLVEAIKEQQKQIEELKSIINDITK